MESIYSETRINMKETGLKASDKAKVNSQLYMASLTKGSGGITKKMEMEKRSIKMDLTISVNLSRI